jgi:predicted Ser/Thr protein kinase
MDTRKHCQSCLAPLADDAPQGLCPACLMKAALTTGSVADDDRTAFTPPTIEELAAKFPQLELIELIGRGGMGAVYKARQKELDRLVALKILPPGIGTDAAFAGRFAREAKALARLNHPGIVTIHDFGRADGLYFFVMEFVDGVNLRQLLNASRVSAREALAIVPQICDALQFAHDQGIVHRDIKPENILLDRRGRVKVADFGLAKIIDADPTLEVAPSGERDRLEPALTESGKVMGTPQYMSPEQVQAPGEVDHRADIYALGVVFYQMLTGELPGKQIEAPSTKVRIDVRLDEVVLRALEQKPDLRYQQVSVLKTEVEAIAATPPTGSAPEPSAFPANAPATTAPRLTAVKRPRALTVVAALFILTGLWSLIDMLFAGDTRNISISPGAFGLAIGIGLLHRREPSRRIAIWCVWVAFVWLLVLLGWVFGKAFGLFSHVDVVARVLGQPIGSAAGAAFNFIFFGAQILLLPWMFLILKRADVRAVCLQPSPRPRPFAEYAMVALVTLILFGGVRLPFSNPFRTGLYCQRPPAKPEA